MIELAVILGWCLGQCAWGYLAWLADNKLAPYSEDELGNDARHWRGWSCGEVVAIGFMPIIVPFMPLGLTIRVCQVVWLMRPSERKLRARMRLDELLMPNVEPDAASICAWTRRERAALGLDDTDELIKRLDSVLGRDKSKE